MSNLLYMIGKWDYRKRRGSSDEDDFEYRLIFNKSLNPNVYEGVVINDKTRVLAFIVSFKGERQTDKELETSRKKLINLVKMLYHPPKVLCVINQTKFNETKRHPKYSAFYIQVFFRINYLPTEEAMYDFRGYVEKYFIKT